MNSRAMSIKRQRYSFYYSECVALSLDFINIMMELYSATVTKYYVGAELVSADKYNITVTGPDCYLLCYIVISSARKQ